MVFVGRLVLACLLAMTPAVAFGQTEPVAPAADAAPDAVATEPAADVPAPDAAQDGAGPTAARAEHTPTESELADARHAFEVGAAAFENGDYEGAASEFRNAYELSGHPALLYNAYLAEERAGRPGEAALMLERYLETDAPSAEERTLLERRLERLRTRAASRAPVVDPTESAEDRAALIVAPADDAGREWLVPTNRGGPPAAGVALLVIGGVFLATFAVLATLSEVEDQRLASACGRTAGMYCSSAEVETLSGLNIAADVGWIAGSVTAAVGLILLFALPPEGGASTPTEPTVALLPSADQNGAGLTLEGTF